MNFHTAYHFARQKRSQILQNYTEAVLRDLKGVLSHTIALGLSTTIPVNVSDLRCIDRLIGELEVEGTLVFKDVGVGDLEKKIIDGSIEAGIVEVVGDVADALRREGLTVSVDYPRSALNTTIQITLGV